MKHIVILLIIAISTYFAWRGADARTKRGIKKFIGKHVLPLTLIGIGVFLSVAAAFYTNSINIL